MRFFEIYVRIVEAFDHVVVIVLENEDASVIESGPFHWTRWRDAVCSSGSWASSFRATT
jgi:hypothetical protein